jgi:hypothetical protein
MWPHGFLEFHFGRLHLNNHIYVDRCSLAAYMSPKLGWCCIDCIRSRQGYRSCACAIWLLFHVVRRGHFSLGGEHHFSGNAELWGPRLPPLVSGPIISVSGWPLVQTRNGQGECVFWISHTQEASRTAGEFARCPEKPEELKVRSMTARRDRPGRKWSNFLCSIGLAVLDLLAIHVCVQLQYGEWWPYLGGVWIPNRMVLGHH